MKRYRKRRKDKKLNKIKLKNSTRFILVFLSALIFAISSASLLKSVFKQEHTTTEKDIYAYKNNFSSNYTVNMKPNSFITEPTLPSGQTYVADLIDSLDMQMYYQYAESEGVPTEYTYKIEAIINAKYSDNGKEYTVWNKTDTIKELESPHITSDTITIDENFNVDYKKYQNEVLNFKQTLSMSIDAYLYIKLTVSTITIINSEPVENIFSSDYCISVGDKIAVIEENLDDGTPKYVKQSTTNTISTVNIPLLIINLTFMTISAYIIYYISHKTQKLNFIKSEFKLELNRIFKSCETRIVMIETQPEIENETPITVKDFGELIKLSEELYRPILCWISDDFTHNEARFFVIGNKSKYMFILEE